MTKKEKENAFVSQKLRESDSLERFLIKAIIDMAFAFSMCRQYDQQENKTA